MTDWELMFQRQVTANIRAKQESKRKLAEAQLALDQANTRVAELTEEVSRLRPVAAELAACYRARDEELTNAARKVQSARTQYLRGKRSILQDVISYLQEQASRLPEPTDA
jgi:chromosome segregation ATPase